MAPVVSDLGTESVHWANLIRYAVDLSDRGERFGLVKQEVKPSALGSVIGRGELDNSLPGSLLTFNAVEGYYWALTFISVYPLVLNACVHAQKRLAILFPFFFYITCIFPFCGRDYLVVFVEKV